MTINKDNMFYKQQQQQQQTKINPSWPYLPGQS